MIQGVRPFLVSFFVHSPSLRLPVSLPTQTLIPSRGPASPALARRTGGVSNLLLPFAAIIPRFQSQWSVSTPFTPRPPRAAKSSQRPALGHAPSNGPRIRH
jgi:hypothetical protein